MNQSLPLENHNLKIISLNINSLINISRRVELTKFLSDNKPDIVLLNETKLNPKHKIKFIGYNIIRRDRPRATQGGGIAILIRQNIKFSKYYHHSIDSQSTLETCIIKLNMPSNSILYIIAAYYPSGHNNASFITELNTIFDTLDLSNPNHYYILAGDLNC